MYELAAASLYTLSLTLALVVVSTVIIWSLYQSWTSGLDRIPGPWIARYSNIWGALQALKLSYAKSGPVVAKYSRALRDQYGTTVRTGPRAVTILDPEAIQPVYGVRAKLEKVRQPLRDIGPF
jgi:hypothetical protein